MWQTIEKELRSSLIRSLGKIRVTHPGVEGYQSPLVDSLVTCCENSYQEVHGDPDRQVSEKVLRGEKKQLGDQWSAHVFDKAPHRPWLTCRKFAKVLWVRCFLEDPRKREVLRVQTHVEALFLLMTSLTFGALYLLNLLSVRLMRVWRSHPLFCTDTFGVLSGRPLSQKRAKVSSDYLTLWSTVLTPLRGWLPTLGTRIPTVPFKLFFQILEFENPSKSEAKFETSNLEFSAKMREVGPQVSPEEVFPRCIRTHRHV